MVLAIADLAKPWPLALVIDKLVAGREGPFDARPRRRAAARAVGAAHDRDRGGRRDRPVLRRPLAAECRRAHHPRAARGRRTRTSSACRSATTSARQKGDMLTRITGDVNAVGTLFSDSLGAMAQDGLLLIGMVAVVFVLDPVLGLVSIAMMPALAAVSWVYRRRVKAAVAAAARARRARIASIAGEALAAMSVVKAFGSEGYENERVRSRSEERMATGVQVARLQARFDGAGRRADGDRHRARGRGRRAARGLRGPQRRRPAGVRQLRAQGAEPAARNRARGHQDREGARPRRAHRARCSTRPSSWRTARAPTRALRRAAGSRSTA